MHTLAGTTAPTAMCRSDGSGMEMNESPVQAADPTHVKHVLEACLLVAGRVMSLREMEAVFEEDSPRPGRDALKDALLALQADYEGRGIELIEVASGWRLQSRSQMEPWVSRLFQEKTPRYSRALLETLVLIAYRQPITRGEIEDVRGVAVSSNIIKTLQEREWVREVGHKDVPGKPALLGTTRQFLDYFNLKRLEDLPSLGELKDLDQIDAALASELGVVDAAADATAANDEASVDDAAGDVQSADAGSADDSSTTSADDLTTEGDVHDESDAEVDAEVDVSEPPLVELELPEVDPVDLTPFHEPEGGESSSEPEGPSEPYEDPQARLRRVIDQFAQEHQADLDAEQQILPPRPSTEVVSGTEAPHESSPTLELETVEEQSSPTSPPDRDDQVP